MYDILNRINPSIFLLISYILLIAIYKFVIYIKKNKLMIDKYCQLNIYERQSILEILDYMNKFPHFFSKPQKLYIGNPYFKVLKSIRKDHFILYNYYGYLDDIVFPLGGVTVSFNDENFNVKGILYFDEKQIMAQLKDDKQIATEIPCIQMIIEKEICDDINEYYNKIVKKNTNLQESYIYKYLYSFYGRTYSVYKYLYNGPVIEYEKLEKKYLDSFFHPLKKYLITQIKQSIDQNEQILNLGQPVRNLWVFHGPSGSGKQTFINKMCLYFKKNVSKIDLTSISKNDCLRCLNHNNTLFIINDFDVTITELNKRNKSKNYDIYSEKMNLSDLLEFCDIGFKHGLTILAISNDFEKISKLVPQLFLPFRFKPIYFGYPDMETVQEISMYYFKKQIKNIENYEEIIPSSRIIQIAIESKDLDSFETEINKEYLKTKSCK